MCVTFTHIFFVTAESSSYRVMRPAVIECHKNIRDNLPSATNSSRGWQINPLVRCTTTYGVTNVTLIGELWRGEG